MVKICNSAFPSELESSFQEHFCLFPFPLSDFQKYAIQSIVEGHHSLVCAPTGSGKTLPAEFAIQYFTSLGKKVIYTSPIKALSNQKYYEFTAKYPHLSIGLMTGDIKTNPDADVIIMTAEILTNQLFNLSATATSSTSTHFGQSFNINLETELGAVIMDEVHYINDAHRGKTWEHTILLLPHHVQMVMLSATLDQPDKFAEWIENAKTGSGKEVILSFTDHRIVPLTKYGFVACNESFLKSIKNKEQQQQMRDNTNNLILLQDSKNAFNVPGYKRIKATLETLEEGEIKCARKYVLNNICTLLKDKDMLPAICFVMSRKQVEICAKEITANLLEDDSKVPYIIAKECDQIMRKLPNYAEYIALPEYIQLIKHLECGVAIHHSGMLPILREIVELMISKKYVKLLFATESFSIGLDCPIRTAIFAGLNKYDGSEHRFFHPHEYNQMQGRAGRRGIDVIGYVVHLNNLFPLPTETEYKTIMSGKSQHIESKFTIDYGMVLSLLKHGQTDNFHEFADKSMLHLEIEKQLSAQKHIISGLKHKLDEHSKALAFKKTPPDICRTFIDLESKLKTSVNAKKKEVQRQITKLQDEWKYLITDVASFKENTIIQMEYNRQHDDLIGIQTYIKEHTNNICNILLSNDFIETVDVDKYHLTIKGKIASHICEMHPLVFAESFMKWNGFAEFTVPQIIATLSCFCDIKVAEDERQIEPKSKDKYVESRVREMTEIFNKLQQQELVHRLTTGQDYLSPLTYDLIDVMDNWAKCQNEHDCKMFIQTILYERDISVGDFIKACMKINAVAKEIGAMCEYIGYTDTVHKMVQIEPCILKYIATTQSLYL